MLHLLFSITEEYKAPVSYSIPVTHPSFVLAGFFFLHILIKKFINYIFVYKQCNL